MLQMMWKTYIKLNAHKWQMSLEIDKCAAANNTVRYDTIQCNACIYKLANWKRRTNSAVKSIKRQTMQMNRTKTETDTACVCEQREYKWNVLRSWIGKPIFTLVYLNISICTPSTESVWYNASHSILHVYALCTDNCVFVRKE